MSARKKSKVKKWIIFSIVAILVVLLAARFIMKQGRSSYENVNAKTGNITTYYSFSGNVDTKNRQSIMSDKPMQISEVDVKEGDSVKEGDVLLKTTTGDEIQSKIDGEVVNLNVEVDQQVMAGTKLMEIVDYKNLDVAVKVDEYDLSALKVGKAVTVNIDALSKEVKGKISSMSDVGQVENGVTYFPATVDLKKDKSIKIGMSAEVKALSAKATKVITLPMYAIQFDDNNSPYVYIKSGNGKGKSVQRVDITTGINDGSNVEIKKGISSGETVYYQKATATTSPLKLGRGGTNKNNNGGNNNG